VALTGRQRPEKGNDMTDNAKPAFVGTSEAPCSVALVDVLEERRRQDEKWGEQNHDPFAYLTVLGEEYGELCQCALHDRFGGPAAEHIREEAVQVAAVALAIVECLDRGKWRWPAEVQPNTRLCGGADAPSVAADC
jgi:NTP pyrophosphatase (non-canonical NTP hydrolase)